MQQHDSRRSASGRAAAAVLAAVLLAHCASAAAPEQAKEAGATSSAPAVAANKPLRILAIMTIDTMSHHIWMSALTVELARRGHLVTSLDIHAHSEEPPTLNTTIVETAFEMSPGDMKRWVSATVVQQIGLLQAISEVDCKRDLAAPSMQRLLDPAYPGTFDLVIFDYMADCMLGWAHRFGYPGMLAISPFPISPWVDDLMYNPQPASILANTMQPFPHPMNLWQRAWTFFLQGYTKLQSWWWRPVQDSVIKRFFGEDAPSAEELRQHVHLALVNENPILEAARPLPPSMIPVGGMHVKPANLTRIPADLRKWMDDAKDGFVFVSFGSIMKGSYIDADKKRALTESFASLAPVRVLWKIEREEVDTELVAANVRIANWAPQNDLLGHPNLRLFVSHCGGLSVQEASYHGVPVLGTPFFVDQFVNLEKVVRIGMGRPMPYHDITKERFVAETKEMLKSPRYLEAARKVRALLLDQKETPLERAVWWAEYIGRHRGAPHLRSPARDLYWHQVVMLDLAALLGLGVLAVVLAVFLVIKVVVQCVRRSGERPLRREKKD